MNRIVWLLVNFVLLTGVIVSGWFAATAPELARPKLAPLGDVELEQENPPTPGAPVMRTAGEAREYLAARALFTPPSAPSTPPPPEPLQTEDETRVASAANVGAVDTTTIASPPPVTVESPIARTFLDRPPPPSVRETRISAEYRGLIDPARALVALEPPEVTQFFTWRSMNYESRETAEEPPARDEIEQDAVAREAVAEDDAAEEDVAGDATQEAALDVSPNETSSADASEASREAVSEELAESVDTETSAASLSNDLRSDAVSPAAADLGETPQGPAVDERQDDDAPGLAIAPRPTPRPGSASGDADDRIAAVVESQTGDTETGDPETRNPQTRDPQTRDPQTRDTEPNNVEASDETSVVASAGQGGASQQDEIEQVAAQSSADIVTPAGSSSQTVEQPGSEADADPLLTPPDPTEIGRPRPAPRDAAPSEEISDELLASPRPTLRPSIEELNTRRIEAAATTRIDGVDAGPSDMILLGVFTSRGDERALVRTPTGGLLRVVLGDEVDGWRVTSITQRSVLLRRDTQTKQLTMP